MTISFVCQSCRSEFEVDDKLAGKNARCNRCNHRMKIPTASSSRKAALPAAAAMASASARRVRSAEAASAVMARHSVNWLDAVSQLKLKPISSAMSPAVRRILDKPEDSITSYKVNVPKELQAGNVLKKQVASKAARMADAASAQNYRFFNRISRFFRWLNDTAYGISIIFLIVASTGVIIENHKLVVFGVSMIVLLNVAGLAAGIANLITINFRKNPMRGLLFLIPPVTIYYLNKDWKKWRKPIGRIVTPASILVLVGLAYAFLPWVNGSKSSGRDLNETLNAIKSDVKDSIKTAREEIGDLKGQLPSNVKQLNVDDLKKQVSDQFHQATSNDGAAPEKKNGPPVQEGSP